MRVSAQLIDARLEYHVWAERYDRDLADVFAIQSEIAKTIADQLQAKIYPKEIVAIEKAPIQMLSCTIFIHGPGSGAMFQIQSVPKRTWHKLFVYLMKPRS